MNTINNRITSENIHELKDKEIFVFGSNPHGAHFGGAAKIAYERFGAVMGQANGLQGQSFAINSMSGLNELKKGINGFILFASDNPDKKFLVTQIGCGIAGFSADEIAPLFKDAIDIKNIHLSQSFWDVILKKE